MRYAMELQTLIDRLQSFYDELGDAFAQGQERSGLACLPGCGQCCLNPAVEASYLEMLPMAMKLCREGRGQEVLAELLESRPVSCWAYTRTSPDGLRGYCGQYQTRPTICREFGVAGTRDKHGAVRLSVCKHIRDADPSRATQSEASEPQWSAPLMEDWTMRLLQLHPQLLEDSLPISRALAIALEKVLLHEALRDSQNSAD